METTPFAAFNELADGGFATGDLQSLREELLRAGLDTWQAGELIKSFLVARGFGVSVPEARTAASRLESASCTIECMRQELSQLALPA